MNTFRFILFICLLTLPVFGGDITVAKSGGDYSVIQDALDAAVAGDIITVHAGTYEERLYINQGGSAGSLLVLQARSGDTVYLSGKAQSNNGDPNIIYMENQSYVTISGFNICSNKNGSGIFIEGEGTHIAIISNTIYEMRGTHGMGITVYGTSGTPISDLVIHGNEIYDCEPATSEALTLNGNVTGFEVVGNYVHDVNNIGIDFIGGEDDINDSQGARNGLCAENRVERARSSYGGGFAAGIYVDGGCNIVIERNSVTECDMGIEVGAENSGWNTTNITIQSNLLFNNDKVGIVFGGYDSSVGRVQYCNILNNTLVRNNRLSLSGGDFHGECIIQYAANNTFENNVIYVDELGDKRALSEEASEGNSNNLLDYNLYYCNAGLTAVQFQWKNAAYTGYSVYTNAVSDADEHSLGTNPLFDNLDFADYHLTLGSPAIDGGDPTYLPGGSVTDYDGNPRILIGRVDIGAYEFIPEPGTCLLVCVMAGLILKYRQ